MVQNDFVVHAGEQVLRFTRADKWDDLTEARKVQLGFNMGVIALSLDLGKNQSFDLIASVREGNLSMADFHHQMKSVIEQKGVKVNPDRITKPFT